MRRFVLRVDVQAEPEHGQRLQRNDATGRRPVSTHDASTPFERLRAPLCGYRSIVRAERRVSPYVARRHEHRARVLFLVDYYFGLALANSSCSQELLSSLRVLLLDRRVKTIHHAGLAQGK